MLMKLLNFILQELLNKMDRRTLLGLWVNAIENGNKKEEKRIMDMMAKEQKNYSEMKQKRGFFTNKKKGDK